MAVVVLILNLYSSVLADPYIVPPDSSIYTIVIAVVGGVLGLAIIIIIVLVCLWCVKSKKRSKERFERQSSIRSSVRGSTIRSRSTMSMLSGHSKRRLDQLSLSSSKYLYDQKSLGASQVCYLFLTVVDWFNILGKLETFLLEHFYIYFLSLKVVANFGLQVVKDLLQTLANQRYIVTCVF